MNNKKITLKQIAESVGVSVGTVHRAIYGKPGVGEETRKLILSEVEKNDYKIDEIASMMKRKELNVAVVLPKPVGEDQYYFRGIWAGIRAAAKGLERYKITYTFYESPHNLDTIALALKELYDTESGAIQGLITIADDADCGEWVSRFSRRGIPVILISSYEENIHCVASIKVDHTICGQLAADYFAVTIPEARGRIMLLAGHNEIYSNRIYASSFASYIGSQYPGFEIIRVEGFGKDKVDDKIRRLFAEHEFCGVFTCNARNTHLMCEALSTLEQGNPITFVGTDVFNELEPFFRNGTIHASIYQSHREQGLRAVQLMHEHLTRGAADSTAAELPPLLVFKSNFKFFTS